MHHVEPNDWKKYILTFLVTGALFLSAFWVSNYFNDRKIDQVKIAEEKISLDLMSSEIQFSLLQEMSCADVSTNALSSELNSLADRITYSETNIGTDDSNVVSLKKYYSILEIKDYLLMKRITERCGQKSVFVLYFYSNDNCADCTKQGYVLTSLREKYPNLRVYSFDYNLDLSAIRAMISIYNVPENLPALVINGKVYSGFQSIEAVEKNFPQLKTIKKKEPIPTPKTQTEEKKSA
ncbi:MAG: thioredoxin family protein [Candidatus Pacebacteria bacterium]|nr:thioredoxin family protein [Candidatus Paceibacterota bacterium]